jgi:tetratricopeptide (TPR) repeat protein
MRQVTLLLGLFTMAVATAASAAEPTAPAPTASPGVGPDGVRRDPKGIKGISPVVELVNKGDRAYVSRDFDGALAAYREAIQAEPQNPLGHYRAGAAQLARGDQKEAEAAWVAGLRFAGQDGSLKARLLFALADLRERQKNSDEALARWKDYAKTAEDYKEAVTYPATAVERVSRNEAWKKNATDSAAVKERIARRLKEADDASRKSAADPKNK